MNAKTGGYERAARGAVLRRRARALRLPGRLSFAKCVMALRSSQLAFVWYPGPSALSQAMTSESKRIVTGRFAGRWNFPISAALQSRTGGASEKSMPLSLVAAMARTSRFCAFVSFLIGFPFIRRGGTSRNDTNDFFLAFFTNRMNDQEDRARSDRSNGYPAFLVSKGIIPLGEGIGIIENKNSAFKSNIMLARVLAVLVLIPCKSHSEQGQYSIAREIGNVNTFVRTDRPVNFSAHRLYTDFSMQISFTNFSAQRFYSSSSWANSSGADLVLGLRLVRARASSIILAMRRSRDSGVRQ